MSRRTLLLLFLTAVLTGLIGFKLESIKEKKEPPLLHKLKAPLMLAGGSSNDHRYLLPAGTSLYFDRAFPEGFVRYKVYVNVEGVSLDVAPPSEKFWLDPLTAFPVGREQLAKPLKDYPLTKDELRAILGSGALSKEDIKAVLEEFSK